MAIPKPEAPGEQQNPYLPAGPEPLICDQFMGINTSTTRVGVDEKQLAWCSGWFPIGPYQLRTMPGIGTILWTAPTSNIVYYEFANIGTSPVAIVFLSDGSIWQINTATAVATNIAPTNTIQNPSAFTVGVSQWGSQYILIIAKQTNGYFIWDGTVLYQAGSLAPVVTITNAGSNYTSAPTVGISGGSGAGATFTAQINLQGAVISINVTYGGSSTGYTAVNGPGQLGTISISGGGGLGATATPSFTFIGPSDSLPGYNVYQVTAANVTNGGSGYVSAPSVTYNAGGGLNSGEILSVGGVNYTMGPPILTAVLGSASPVTGITITNAGSGYKVGETPALSITGGGGSGATATVTLMPFGLSGTDVETAFQRVWIINGALLQFSAPSAVSNFSTASGGGSVTSNDSFLRVGYTRLIQTNGFLYLIGDSSLNYISGVQTTGSPPTTTFTNQNADPEVGSPFPASVITFGRNIMMANTSGVYVSYGAAVTKVSQDLDGVQLSNLAFASGKAIVFNKKVFVLLMRIIDPVTNTVSNELFLWDGAKKWWSTKQDIQLKTIGFQEINSQLTCWGTDGASLFPLFQNPSTGFTKTMQTKLWSKPGGYQVNKADTRFWGAVQYYAGNSQTFTVTIDTEYSAQPYTLTPPDVGMTWTEEGITPMTWTTNGSTPMTWTLGPLGIRVFDPQAIGQQGVLNGFTASTNADDVAIISMSIQPEVVGYRG